MFFNVPKEPFKKQLTYFPDKQRVSLDKSLIRMKPTMIKDLRIGKAKKINKSKVQIEILTADKPRRLVQTAEVIFKNKGYSFFTCFILPPYFAGEIFQRALDVFKDKKKNYWPLCSSTQWSVKESKDSDVF